jgi:tetratricopeptide (TPR) repeat protein
VYEDDRPGYFDRAAIGYWQWLLARHYTVAAMELYSRRDKYDRWFDHGVSPDTIRNEVKDFMKWLERGDYGMPTAEFVKYVVKNYNPVLPLYFASDVPDEYLRDLIQGDSIYLASEGLVQSIVVQPGPRAPDRRLLDVAQTRHLMDSVYVTASMSDRRVPKDGVSSRAIGNVALVWQELAEQFDARAGQFDKAGTLIDSALQLDLEPGQRAPLYLAQARYAALNDHYDKSLLYLDSLQHAQTLTPLNQPISNFQFPISNFQYPISTSSILLRSFVGQLQGDFAEASGLIATALGQRLSAADAATFLDRLYVQYAQAHGFDHPRQVLARWQQYNPSDSMPLRIGAALDDAER